MSDRGLDPELVAEQIDLAFRVLDDMERFLGERQVSAAAVPAQDRAE
jgi:hypothetical protein